VLTRDSPARREARADEHHEGDERGG